MTDVYSRHPVLCKCGVWGSHNDEITQQVSQNISPLVGDA
jgi:hypothetical protein